MSDSYRAACGTVVKAFISAYPVFLKSRLDSAAPGMEIGDGVRQGAQWLEGELSQWAAQAAGEQRRGPLQIFQTAMAFPTAALQAAGVPPLERDVSAAQALPGDLYGLAPASSRDIGGDAWRAHIEWGIAKAKLIADVVPAGESPSDDASTGPGASVALAAVTMSQADRAAIHLVASGRGLPVRHWRNPGAIAGGLEGEIPRWAVVDSDHGAADEAVRMLAAAGVKVAVYGPDPDDIAMARWLALGAATVVPHDRLVAMLESWLPLQA
jgi:hypothetical protein